MSTPSDRNPYQPPKADVTPPAQDFESGDLIENGQSVPIGNSLQWIGDGFRLFGKAPGIWIVNIILLFIMTIVLAFIPIIGSLASNVLMPVITAGIMLGCRALENDEPLEVGHLFAGFKENVGQLVLIGVFLLVGAILIFIGIVVIALVMFGGGLLQHLNDQAAMMDWLADNGIAMILLLVLISMALFIPLAMASWFAPALVVFHKLDAIPALKQSFLGCLKNFLPFLLYGLVLLVLMLIGMLPLFLGLLVFFPMAYASIYASYKDIFVQSKN